MHFNKSCFSSLLLLAAGSCLCWQLRFHIHTEPRSLPWPSKLFPGWSLLLCPLPTLSSWIPHTFQTSLQAFTYNVTSHESSFPNQWLICQDELPPSCSLWLYPQPTAIVPPHPTGIFLALSSQLYLSAQLTALTTALC